MYSVMWASDNPDKLTAIRTYLNINTTRARVHFIVEAVCNQVRVPNKMGRCSINAKELKGCEEDNAPVLHLKVKREIKY